MEPGLAREGREGGQPVDHVHRIPQDPRLDRAGPRGEPGDADPPLPDVDLLAAQGGRLVEVGEPQVVGIGVAAPVHLGAVVRGEQDQRVVALPRALEGVQHLPDARIQVLQRGEEEPALGIRLGLDLPVRVVEPGDLVLVEPALRVLRIELSGAVHEAPALVQRRVHGLVGEVEEERSLPVLLEEAHGVRRQQVRGVHPVLVVRERLVVPVPGLGELALAVPVVVHPDRAREGPVAGLEAEVVGAVVGRRSQVPLAAEVRVVAGRGHQVGHGRRPQGERGRVAGLHGGAPEAAGRAPGHEGHPRGGALGHRVVSLEEHAPGREGVQVGRDHRRVVGAEVGPALVVREDDQDVGRGALVPRLGSHGPSASAQGDQQDELQGPERPGWTSPG